MELSERLKYLRKDTLKITCNQFAEPLHVSGKIINMIERGNANLTDRLANAICDEYSVNYQWLVDGEDVPMFVANRTILDDVQKEYNLTDAELRLVKYYFENPDKRQIIIDEIIALGDKLKKAD